ncbi:MAG: phage minor head protein [Cypionkella sp.]
MTDLSASFGKPFAQQVAAFRIRLANLQATANWKDVWQAEHDRAFMVAGAQKAALLADLAAAVDKAITQGTTLETFRKDFSAAVEAHDWHGWTGEETEKGRAWRTRLIYRTNLSTSYAAGRFAQLKEAGFTHWVYLHGNAREPRLQHLAWNGLILPADHPFWASHYPPNGWGCTCHVAGARSAAGAQRRGGKADVTLQPGWDQPDPKTGVPKGIGKGWGYAPGASVADAVNALRSNLETLPPQPSIDLIQNWVRSNVFEHWTQNPVGNFPLVRLSETDASSIGSTQMVAVLSPASWKKQLAHHPDLASADYAQAQQVVSHPTGRVQQDSRRMIFIQEDPAQGGFVLVVKAVVDQGELFVVSFRRMSIKAALRARDIAGLLKKGN